MSWENMATPIRVNDSVKIDGSIRGRVISIVKPLGTFSVYNIKTVNGETRQVHRHRITVVPETVSMAPRSTSPISLPDDVFEELFRDNFFDEVSDETSYRYDSSNIESYIKQNRNQNTWKKTDYDINILTRFMKSNGDRRPVESIPPSELCDILCSFFIETKKSNGQEYEPNSLTSKLSSFDRYLKDRGYAKSLLNDREFSKLREVLSTKQKILKSEGHGNLPNRAEGLSSDEIQTLYDSGELGPSNPEAILNTLWWNNTRHFGIRSVKPHHLMRWGDIELKTDSEGGEFLEYNERQTKTRTGSDIRNVRDVPPRAWATNDVRCPVSLYKLYAGLRPRDYCSPDTPFYLATNSKSIPRENHPWFKRGPVGKNKIGSIMKRMASTVGITSKRLTNHSARKTMIQSLRSSGVAGTEIMQISGHKNIQSVNNYSSITTVQHRQLSNIISCDGDLALQKTMPPQSKSLNACSMRSSVAPTPSRSEFVNSIFSAPIYGGTINISFCGNHCQGEQKCENLSTRPVIEPPQMLN